MRRTLSMLLAVCMVISLLCLPVLAVEITEKPANGTTEEQPFPVGAGGSDNFRIPGIVTLNDGTLIAACDARWNHTGDGAGLDTIVAVSHDNGATWEHTFANYLGDNGNTKNILSTCIIDPAIGTDGTTAYLIADLFPAGIALNTSKYSPIATENGFDEEGHLLLRALADDTVAIGASGYNTMAGQVDRYQYYLDLEELTLHNADGTAIEGYTVDAYFNITGEGVDTNLFFSDSPYQPYPTDYLYLVTSTDGLNWSEPTLLNLQDDGEQTLLIGPGNGTYDAVNDRMIFTAYEYTSGWQLTSLLWRDSEGNWKRTADATTHGTSDWSSEATSVVLADGTIRCFYRDGYSSLRYTDYTWDEAAQNYVPGKSVTTAATKTYNNQISAIKYSQKIDGKDAILVSTANTTSNARRNGTLYVFLVDENNAMELAYAYDIFPGTDDYYAYSCISEMDDGNIALLYEGDDGGSGYGRVIFKVLEMDQIVTRYNDARLDFVEFEVLTGDTYSVTDNSGYYVDADTSELDTSVATVEMTGEQIFSVAAQLGSDATYSGDTIAVNDCVYSFTANEDGTWTVSATDAGGNAVYLYPGHTTSSGYPNAAAPKPLTITTGYEDGTFHIYSADCDNNNGSGSYLYFDRSGLRWDRVSSFGGNTTWMVNTSLYLYRQVDGAGSEEIPGYERVTELADVTAGNYLVVGPGSNGNLYALYPNTSTANRYCQIAKILGASVIAHTDLTFTGVGAGYTEVQIGKTLYMITVADVTEVDVTVPVAGSVTVVEPNGNYEGADTSELDTSIATVVVEGSDGTNESGVAVVPSTELVDGTYVIVNTRANKLLNNNAATAAAAAGAGSGRELAGTTNSFNAETAVWTITAVSGGYTVQDTNGQYLTIGSTTADMVDDPQTLAINYNGTTWTIAQNGAYLNHFGGGSSTCAAGWQDGSAAGDPGSQFAIYAYSTEQTSACTNVTFTGVYPGSTSVTIGRTQYNVNVTGEVVDVNLGVGECAEFILDGNDWLDEDPDPSVATVGYGEFMGAQLGTDATYSGEYVDLADCLFTFDKNEDGTWTISSTDADGNTVYLEGYSSTNGYPVISEPTPITIGEGFEENTVTFYSYSKTADRSGYLFFWRDGRNYFDRVDRTSGFEAGISFELNRLESDAYYTVESVDDIVDGGQYFIGASTGSAYYVVYPTTSQANRYAQAGRLRILTVASFRGVAEGETTARSGSTIFEITVGSHTEHDYEYIGMSYDSENFTWAKAHFACTICGEEVQYDAEVEVERTEATCTEWGRVAYYGVYGDIREALDSEWTEPLGHDYVDGSCTRCGAEDPVIASGWSGYTTWVLTSDGTLTFSPTEQKEKGQTNLKNYWKVDGVLTLPWGEYAEMITKVVIEDGIHDIGQMAFYELPNLVEVDLGADVVEIRNYAFKNCKSLTTINLENVQFIRQGAFYGCSALESVNLYYDVYVEEWAFAHSGIEL